MTKLALDPTRSRLRVRTFAEGLFARLAHDLELECRGLSGTGEREDADSGRATLEVPIARIEIAGTLRSGRVDADGLSPSDRGDALAKMRSDVFHSRGGADAVRVSGTLDRGEGRVEITTPNGRTFARSLDVKLRTDGAELRIAGEVDLSLAALGSSPVKGPMNAFRMKDKVLVHFDLVFTEER